MDTTKKIKKTIGLVSVVCVGLAALLGILLLFEVLHTSGLLGQIYLSLLIIVVAGLFLLNSVEAIARKNKFGLVAMGLICFSALLFFLIVWSPSIRNAKGFLKFIVIVAMLSILFNLIVGTVLSLGKQVLAVQCINYVSFVYIEVSIATLIIGSSFFFDKGMWRFFLTACIIFVALLIVLSVKKKTATKQAKAEETANAEPVTETVETVTIPKAEYEQLLAKAEAYDKALQDNLISK